MAFDLVVLGTEAAGLEGARLASEFGQRVAVIENPQGMGTVSFSDDQPARPSSVDYFTGSARFTSMNCLEIADSGTGFCISARRFLLACGTRPHRPAHVPFDGGRILESDEIANLADRSPSVLVVGAGSHGVRTAAELLERGMRVSLVDQKKFQKARAEPPQSEPFWRKIHAKRCSLQWGTVVLGVEPRQQLVSVYYENGAIESYAAVVFAVGRLGRTEHLNLPRADLLLDESQRVWCDAHGRTMVPHISAVGSVVGFPRFPGSAQDEAVHVIRQMFSRDISRASFLKPAARKALVHR